MCQLTSWVGADFSRDDYQGPPMTNLLDIIDYVKPTALLGLSTITVTIAHCLRRSSALTIYLPGRLLRPRPRRDGRAQPAAHRVPLVQPRQARGVLLRRRSSAHRRLCALRVRLALPRATVSRPDFVPGPRKQHVHFPRCVAMLIRTAYLWRFTYGLLQLQAWDWAPSSRVRLRLRTAWSRRRLLAWRSR